MVIHTEYTAMCVCGGLLGDQILRVLLMSSASPKAPCFNPREKVGFVVSSGNKSLHCLLLQVPFIAQSRRFFTPTD